MADDRIRELEIMIRLIDIEIILARRREGRQEQANRRRRRRVDRVNRLKLSEGFCGPFCILAGRIFHGSTTENCEIKMDGGNMILNCSRREPAFCFNISTNSVIIQPQNSDEIWTPVVIQRVVSIVVIMVLTLIGNIAIILVLTCSNYRKRNNRVNIFIINLAVGDLMVCVVTMTTEILFVAFGEWVLGQAGCKLLTYIQVVTLSSTTFILTAMGLDRYMAICKPLRFTATNSRARKMIICSWILSLIVSIPQFFIFVQTVDGYHSDYSPKYGCHSRGYTAQWQRKLYMTFMSFYILIFPGLVLSYCYINVARVVWKQGKSETYLANSDISLRRFIVNKGVISLAKMKTVKMTFCIILSFIACWTPYFVTTLCLIYSNYTLKIPSTVMAFAETIALLQSAVNPVLYGIFNIKIFASLVEICCPHRLNKKRFNSYARCNDVNGLLISATSDRRHKITSNQTKHLPVPSSSTSRSHGGCIIAESNVNGFKLRVRFMTKEPVHVHDRNGRCLYTNGKSCEAECTV
ncbi:neuropeptide S receptor-like [Mya arenaria]|uniref:neuropeptide S receptor-like n=1 Tax=Mya arenaria TaxID=6604 RepID=UPI0022E57CAD|nr:neuropeptide S receptor-like [Mya arenaria]